MVIENSQGYVLDFACREQASRKVTRKTEKCRVKSCFLGNGDSSLDELVLLCRSLLLLCIGQSISFEPLMYG